MENEDNANMTYDFLNFTESLKEADDKVLDFTGEGQDQLPYQCEFCTILLIPHSDPNRLTRGRLWICPKCGTIKDDALPEPIMGARPSGTVMDNIKPSNMAGIQFIDEEKGLPNKRQNRMDQLINEEFHSDPVFRKRGIVKDSIKVQETINK